MGKLIVIPTPIGNLEDITLRALRMLREANLVLAEDTRTTQKLMQHYELKNTLRAFHMHNEHRFAEQIAAQLADSEETYALVSDAGTPGISDPAYLLVRACLDKGVAVECLPGATAFVPALIKSGLPATSFVFEGFLPHKKGRQTQFRLMATETRTMIFYESPHRLLKSLEGFREHLGGSRQASVSRELTKIYEETINATLDELILHFRAHAPRGEFVIVIMGRKGKAEAQQVEEEDNPGFSAPDAEM